MNRENFNQHLQDLINLFHQGVLQNYPFELRQWHGCISNKYIVVKGDRAEINREVVDKIKDWEFNQ